jgi:ubiquinone/menaquinone biosynthesis C-methylase UbiE
MSKYVQYGCGHSAPKEWINFDISPTLRIQKTPIIGTLLKNQLNTTFPVNVIYGDIVKGLPVEENSCDGLYCSHVLEHLSLHDFRKALRNSYKILKTGGIFRCVVPDLELSARSYLQKLDSGENNASTQFMENTLLGMERRPRGLRQLIGAIFGNSHHLWMWDNKSLGEELKSAGFSSVRSCTFNDSRDDMFKFVEDEGRFVQAAAVESIK